MNGRNLEWRQFLWEMLKDLAIGAAAIFSFLASQGAETARIQVEQVQAALQARGQQSEFDIKAYELVERALSMEGTGRLAHSLAAAAIVSALTQPPLQHELLNALRAGTTDPGLVRKLDDARQFDLDSEGTDFPELPVSSERSSRSDPSWWDRALDLPGRALVTTVWAQPQGSVLPSYRVDIFYCEAAAQATTEARRTRAEQAAEKLKGSQVAQVRTRLLPSLVQARPGYQSFADEVRFNQSAGEKQAAADLARILGISPQSLRPVTTKTVRYLSVFYCAP